MVGRVVPSPLRLSSPPSTVAAPAVAVPASTASSPTVSPSTAAPVLDPQALRTIGVGAGKASHPAALRELTAHAAKLGVPLDAKDLGKAIHEAELGVAQRLDARVTPADAARAATRSARAAHLQPVKQTALFGFTRVVDAKLALSPALVGALAASVGGAAPDQLLDAIARGPGDGTIAWLRPTGRVELVASLVRQLVLGRGASLQLTLEPKDARWLEENVATLGQKLSRAMGGAGAFGANIAAAQNNVTSRYYSKDPLPEQIADRFARNVEIVDGTGTRHSTQSFSKDEPARVNYSAEYNAGEAFEVLGRKSLIIDGASRALVVSGSGRMILSTKASDVKPGFDGVSDAALRKMARDSDLFFFVGTHHMTNASPTEARQAAAALAGSLATMKAENDKLVRHLQYVVAKNVAHEALVLTALKGQVESLSMNAVEVPGLAHRLYAAGASPVDIDPAQRREASEEPAAMLSGALALQEGLALSRVHLHGLEGDLVVQKGPVDPERQVLALLRARHAASHKAANDGGEIKSPADQWPVLPTVRGEGLAALQRFADAVAERYGLSDAARAKVVERWWHHDEASGQTVIFSPSRGIHDRTGGTISLGDTIDLTALLYGREDARPPKLLHPSAL